MNQPQLSRLPLASLALSYACGESYSAEHCWSEQLSTLGDRALANLLARDAQRFQTLGLDAIDSDERRQLADDYRRLSDPAAQEVADWLDELYRFDPACLND